MITFDKTAKISRRGQITLPKHVRSALQTEVVRIVIEDETVRIEPVRGLAGSLREYAKRPIPHDTAHEEAWSQAMHEKHVRD